MVSLTCDTPPSEDVVSLAAVKAHLFVSDTESDTHLQGLIAAAAAACSIYCGRGFGVATYVYTLDEFPANDERVRLPVVPLVVDETEIGYVDEDGAAQTMDAADLLIGLRTGQIAPAEYWPATRFNRPDAVTVTFQAGKSAATLPKQAKQAILLTVGDWWANRGYVGGAKQIPTAAMFLLDQLKSGSVD